MATFAQLMREQRAARGLTFAQLATEVGYHPSYLSLVERGLRLVDEEGVVRLARALGLDPTRALLSALRERLPENLRGLVPTEAASPTQEAIHAAAREVQAGHFEFEVDRILVHAAVDWDGGVAVESTLESCRPNASGRPVWEIAVGSRIVGLGRAGAATVAVTHAPLAVEHEVTCGGGDLDVIPRISFPRGWRRSPHPKEDALTVVQRCSRTEAYCLDASAALGHTGSAGLRNPLRRCFGLRLGAFTGRLEVVLEFPAGYQAERWEGWAWWGDADIDHAPRNLAGLGPSRGFELRDLGNRAELSVHEPLAGYTYAIVFNPADRQTFLEARYRAGSGSPDAASS